MKKNLFSALMALCLLIVASPAKAQSLEDLVNKAKDVVQTVTGQGRVDMVGTWIYSGPAIELKSDNVLSKAGGSLASNAIEKKINETLAKAGIKPGNTKFTFAQDSTFTISWSGKQKQGTYSYDASTKKVALKFNKLATFHTTVKATSSELDLLYDADKLFNLITTLTSKSNNAQLKSLTSLAKNYNGMQMGFALKKE